MEKPHVVVTRQSPKKVDTPSKKVVVLKEDDSEEFILGKRKQPSRHVKKVRFNTIESSEELDHKVPSAKIYKERLRLRSVKE